MGKTLAYSVVIPFYNEEESVEELLGKVSNVMDSLGETYEIIALNDGSTDETRGKLEEMRRINPVIIPIHFIRNKGQTACLKEGFEKAKGDTVISMDGDLQDDPMEIPSMLKAFKGSKADVVCGWRKNRKDPAKTLSLSKLGNFFQKRFLQVPIHDISCTFRIYKKEAIKNIKLERAGLHRYLPFILKRNGFTLTEKEVNHKPREHGHSKYSVKKAPETVKLFFGLLLNKY